MASHSIMSNVLSERFASRRLAKRESKDRLRVDERRWHRRRVTHYVYLLRCADNSLYVGETSDLQTRERDHNEGRGGSYTAKRRPVQIVYAERHSSREEALRREQQIKPWNSKKKELLVRGDVTTLSGNSQRARVRTGFTWEDWLTRPRQ
jgi:putative endonuclease